VSAHASEAGHWYNSDGEPCYTIVGKNGVERPTTLRDARKLNLYPSVTTIIGCAAAPGLERWKQEQVLHAALTLPRLDGELEDAWIKRVWDDSREQARRAAERGTQIHGAIERWLLGDHVEPELMPYVEAAMGQVDTVFGKSVHWEPEHSFVHPDGYGGKVDLHSSNGIVVDFKTKDGDPAGQKLYDSHHMQLAAYARGLGAVNPGTGRPICAIVFVSRDTPVAEMVMAGDDDLDRGLDMFTALLRYWQAKTGYRPAV